MVNDAVYGDEKRVFEIHDYKLDYCWIWEMRIIDNIMDKVYSFKDHFVVRELLWYGLDRLYLNQNKNTSLVLILWRWNMDEKEKFGIDSSHSELLFLKELEQYSFDSKMIMCQRFASRIMSCSEVDMKRAFSQNIMPWELETFATFSTIYDNDSVKCKIDIDTFFRIITKIRNYWHPELTMAEKNGTYQDVFMMITALQQFPVQGVFLQKLFRYHFFFNFCNTNIDMGKEFKNKFHTQYINFEIFAFIIFVYCSRDANIQGDALSCKKLMSKAFKIEKVFEQLCIEKNEYRKQLENLYKNNILDYYYGLKIQYVYPLVCGKDFTYIPSPYLVINAVTESLLNRFTLNDKKLRRALGKEVIENYLLRIYRDVPSVTWISNEFNYNIGKDDKLTPDVFVEEDDYCTFYDTKAITPSLKVRQFNKAEIEKDIEIYAEDVIQVYQQIENFLAGHFTLNKNYDRFHIFGVVVVLEDAAVPRKKVYGKVFEILSNKIGELSEDVKRYIHSHVKIVPLRQIEQMVLQNMSFLSCLNEQENNPEQWNNLNFGIPSIEHGLLSIYEDYVSTLKKQVVDFLR